MANALTLTLKGSDNYYISEAFNVLRTNIQFCGADKKVICITSVRENEGKTTISLHVAAGLANIGKKVLFIDADMRKSVVSSRHTDAVPTCGLSEFLTGQKDLSECIWATQFAGLSLLFSGAFPPSSADLLNGAVFKKLIEACRTYYDYIIIDTAPVGAVIDAAIIAGSCDGVLLVCAGEKVHSRDVRNAAEQVSISGTPILGVVRNMVSSQHKGYYYSQKKYGQYGSNTEAQK